MMKDALLMTKNSVYKILIDVPRGTYDEVAGIKEKEYLPQLIVESKMQNEIFFKQPNLEFIYPDNCKIFLSNASTNKFWFVIEQPPQFRTITTSKDLRAEVSKLNEQGRLEEYGFGHLKDLTSSDYQTNPSVFNLFFPYCIFIVYIKISSHFQGSVTMEHILYYGWRKTPLRSIDDSIYLSPLTNVYDDCRVCTGMSSSDVLNSIDFSRVVNTTVSNFWQTNFNNDVGGSAVRYIQDHTSNLDLLSWAFYSKINPMFIFNENFKNTYSIMQILKASGYSQNLNETINLDCDASVNIYNQKLFYKVPKEIIITSKKTNKAYSFRIGDKVKLESTGDKEYTVRQGINKHSLLIIDDEDNQVTLNAELLDRRKVLDEICIPVDGEEITIPSGSLMKCSITGKYCKINEISKDLDTEIVELIVGNRRMLLNENVLKHWKLVETVTFNGTEINKNKEYELYASSHTTYNTPVWLSKSKPEKVKSIEDQNGELIIVLHSYSLSINDYNKLLIDVDDDTIEWHSAIAFGNKFLGSPWHDIAYVNNRILVKETSSDSTEYANRLIKIIMPEEDRIYVKSHLQPDIDLKVGDEVVAILKDGTKFFGKIETINTEVKNQYYLNINVTVINNEGESQTITYFEGSLGFRSNIHVENIRKIDYAYKGYEVGKRFKLIKKVKCFLKINLYEIEGVITDCLNHMVLFTNGQTIYVADMPDLFEEISPKNPAFSRKVNTEPYNEYQIGDLILSSNYHKYFIAKYEGDPKIRFWSATSYGQSVRAIKHENSKIYGIPAPRFLDDELIEIPIFDIDYRGGFLFDMKGRNTAWKGLVERRILCSE